MDFLQVRYYLACPEHDQIVQLLQWRLTPTAPRALPRSPALPMEEAHHGLLRRPVPLRIIPHSPSIPRPPENQPPSRPLQGSLPGSVRQVSSLRSRQSKV